MVRLTCARGGDPEKVVIQALHNAVLVTGLLIRCDVAITLTQK